MKKFLLSLAAIAMSCSAVSAADLLYDLQFGSSVNVDQKYYPKNSSYTATFDYTLTENAVFEVANFNNNNNGWADFIKCGRKGNASVGSITSLFTIPDQVTSVVLGISKFNEAGMVNGIYVERSLDNATWERIASATESEYDAESMTLTIDLDAVAEDAYYRIAIDCASAKGNGVVWLSSVEIYGQAAISDDRKPAGLSFNKPSFTIDSGLHTFTGAILSNPNNLEVTYTSSNPAVAEINENYIKINGVGTTIITAESEATEEFQAGKASYTLNVVAGATNISKMIDLAPAKGDKVFVTGDLTVVFVSGSYVYVTDMLDYATLLYGSNDYAIGDVIPSGWEATNNTYNGLLEWSGSFPAASGKEDLIHYDTVTSISEDDVNRVVWLKGIKFSESTPESKASVEITLDDQSTFTLYNQFGLEQMPAATYNVLVAVSLYKNALQLYPCEFVDASTIKEPTFPSSVLVATDGTDVTMTQGIDGFGDIEVRIKGETENDNITISLETPEGWDSVISMHAFQAGDINPLTRAKAAEWLPISYLMQAGGMQTNTITLAADGTSYEFPTYLVYNNQADYANPITFYVDVKKKELTGVDTIGEVVEEAAYYNLQGVKIENPVEGIYVKVVNGKASKVVL